jgi:hypothetical protein
VQSVSRCIKTPSEEGHGQVTQCEEGEAFELEQLARFASLEKRERSRIERAQHEELAREERELAELRLEERQVEKR